MIKNMKNITRKIATLGLMYMLFACESFIDKSPIDQIAIGDFFTNEQNAEGAVIGAYRTLTTSFYYGQAFIVVPEFAAGHMRHISNFPEYAEYETFNIRIDNPWSLNMWTAMYATINAANNVIDRVPRIETFSSDEKRRQLVAEAKFLRSLSYFHLVRGWGSVPLITTPTASTAPQALRVARTPAQEVYAQIIEDLGQAAEDLPTSYATLAATKGRATRWSSLALLAKVNLYAGNYANAAQLAEQVITEGGFSMVTDYATIWTVGNTTEAIFELQFDEQAQNTFVNNANPGSRQEFFASNLAASLFEPGDTRRPFTVNTITDTNGNEIHYVGKYRQFNPPTQNVPLIRITEIMLIYAEASTRATNSIGMQAYDLLASVRQRAGLITRPISEFSTEDFLVAIQDEKRLEMMFESETWFDLCRTSRALSVLNVPNADRFVFPIPQLELDLNPALSQNNGY
jgi:hypothetical protein